MRQSDRTVFHPRSQLPRSPRSHTSPLKVSGKWQNISLTTSGALPFSVRSTFQLVFFSSIESSTISHSFPRLSGVILRPDSAQTSADRALFEDPTSDFKMKTSSARTNRGVSFWLVSVSLTFCVFSRAATIWGDNANRMSHQIKPSHATLRAVCAAPHRSSHQPTERRTEINVR